MATRALEAKRALRDKLKAALTGQPIQVTYGPVRSPERSWAMLGRVDWDTAAWAAIGAGKRSETFSVAVVFNVIARGQDCEAAEALADGYVRAFEDALRADPSLGGIAPRGVALIPRVFNSQPITDASEAQWEGVVRFSDVRN